jgi:Virulence factor membrane-bound polymerase, C-terminal/O-Antigen ligase/Protein glycosylation ligase
MSFTGFRNCTAVLRAENHKSIWTPLWALGLACGWLLPNHTLPWAAFHVDAWIAWFMIAAAIVFLAHIRRVIQVPLEVLITLMIAAIPACQYVGGLLPYAGVAWIGTIFILGFAGAVFLGANWECDQPDIGINALFFAIGLASVVSVGLQLYQWLGLSVEALEMWILFAPGTRPFANLAQPNQLAMLLLWGLLATVWAVTKNNLSRPVAVFLALFLLIGVTLTQSKMAFVAVVAAIPFVLVTQRVGVRRSSVWMVVGLSVVFVFMTWLLTRVNMAASQGAGAAILQTESSQQRWAAYQLFIDAVFKSPWVGYGWSQTALAQLYVATEHPPSGGIFMHAHNLFLDLVIWCGIPLGLLISATAVVWFFDKVRKSDSLDTALLLAFVGAVGWHAMVELPLHYAYFLLPAGLVVGSLSHRTKSPGVRVGWTYAMSLFLVLGVLLANITRDYLLVEKSFVAMRFERANIGNWPKDLEATPVLLDQLDAFVNAGRLNATSNMTEDEMVSIRKAAGAFPSLGNFYTLIVALALNGQLSEAQTLAEKMPKITTPQEYANMRSIGIKAGSTNGDIAKIQWPSIEK